MKVSVSVQRWGGWEFRTVEIDLSDAVEKELRDQCEGIGGIDIDRDGFSIEGIVGSTICQEII